jgi:hypothetical protein
VGRRRFPGGRRRCGDVIRGHTRLRREAGQPEPLDGIVSALIWRHHVEGGVPTLGRIAIHRTRTTRSIPPEALMRLRFVRPGNTLTRRRNTHHDHRQHHRFEAHGVCSPARYPTRWWAGLSGSWPPLGMVGRLRSLRCDLIEHGSASSFTELGFRMEVLRVRRCLPSHRGIRDSLGSARQRKAMTLAHGIKVSILNPLVGSGGRGPATSALPRSARSGRCPTAISQGSPGRQRTDRLP